MAGIPENDYTVTIISPQFFKAAAKIKAEKTQKPKENNNDNGKILSSLDALSLQGRSAIAKLTPEERKEIILDACAKKSTDEMCERYGIDRNSAEADELEASNRETLQEAVEQAEQELRAAVAECVNGCTNTVSTEELEKMCPDDDTKDAENGQD